MVAQTQDSRLIDLKGIYKNFDGVTVLNNINLYIKKNEFVTLLGPSGCGKTTILRIIGGFETPTAGELLFEGKDMLNIPPHKRHVNTIFQKYALFPHMNVKDNVAFGLNIRKVNKKIINEKVEAMLKLVNLSGYEKRSVTSLSGGQQQRVAIARALANDPEVLLLDEPLGALDLKLRQEMQIELKNMQRELGITFIYVTHDQEEALSVSDVVVVMKNGVIQQIDTPEKIYNEPKNAYVADFIGESNIIDGVMCADYKVMFSNTVFECLDKDFEKDEAVDVVIRPEDVRITSVEEGQLTGTVKDVTFKGVHYVMLIKAKNDDFFWYAKSTKMFPPGSDVGIIIIPDAIHVMKKVTE